MGCIVCSLIICLSHIPLPTVQARAWPDCLCCYPCRDTGLTASYTFEPLSNLVYTRDQQITTCKGIVMGRLRSQQRQKEVELMRYCFNKLGAWLAWHQLKIGGKRRGGTLP